MKDLGRKAPPATEESEEGGGRIDGGCIAVPDAKYELRYSFYETAIYFGSPKVVVHFAIDASDAYAGVPVCRFYNVKTLIGPCGRYGNYIASPRSDLPREYRQLVKDPKRMDRISFLALRGRRVLGRLETVTRSYNRRVLALGDQYSRVSELIRVIPDDYGP